MQKQKIITIPNILSFYRVLSFPLVLFFILTNREFLFAIFLIINLVTDVLDGMIARMFNMQTEFGARLDSMADYLTYLLAITGILIFKSAEFAPHLSSFLFYVGLLILSVCLSLIKFKRLPSLHLYSWKIGGYIQGIFLVVLFGYEFVTPLYYFMIGWSILSALEHIVIQLLIPRMISNAKGLYWVISSKNNKQMG